MVECGDKCLKFGELNKKAIARCKEKATCVCNNCSTYRAISPNLYQSCMESCNSEDIRKRPTSKEQFLKGFDPYDLFTRYGIIVEGFDPNKTMEAVKNAEAQKKTDEQQGFLGKIVLMGFAGLCGVLLYFFVKK